MTPTPDAMAKAREVLVAYEQRPPEDWEADDGPLLNAIACALTKQAGGLLLQLGEAMREIERPREELRLSCIGFNEMERERNALAEVVDAHAAPRGGDG
jgi:hypothetical protein